jgi:hypothetical protein
MLSQIILPEGVIIPALASGLEHDVAVANAIHIKESQGSDADVAEAAAVSAVTEEPAPSKEGRDQKDSGKDG